MREIGNAPGIMMRPLGPQEAPLGALTPDEVAELTKET